mgnify:FL=1
MIQCFVKKEYEAPFGLTQMPRLFSVSRTDEKASAHPRVMRAHDDLVEIVLVRGGESRYFVGGTPYEARRGDLFIFNSRVVHDEPSGRIVRWQPRVWRLADWLCPDCAKIADRGGFVSGVPPDRAADRAAGASVRRALR